LLINSVG